MNKYLIGLFLMMFSMFTSIVSTTSAQCNPRTDWAGTYTVVSGDTMYRIARNYGVTTTDLAQGNCIYNVNTIYVGQVLRVPGTSNGGNNNLCTATIPSRLSVGGTGRVLPGLPNNLRQAASVNSTWVGSLAGGTTFSVVAGPTCADGILWWYVNSNGVVGWTGELQSSSYWLEPYNGGIVPPPTGLNATVTAYYLNVRNADGVHGTIIARIQRGQVYAVVSQNSARTWTQLNVNGVIGWVNSRYISIR